MDASPSAHTASLPRWQVVLGWILFVPTLMFVPSAFFKIAQPGDFLQKWSLGYPAAAARPLGLVELGSFVLYFVPKTRVLGAILLTGYLGGAIATHLAKGEPQLVIPLVLGLLLWGSLFLRMPRIRALLPTVE